MEILFTVLSTIAALFALWGAFEARAYARVAQKEAARVGGMRGRLQSLEDAHESLLTQHRKLRGAFYATRAEVETLQEAEPDPQGDPEHLIERGDLRLPPCENYATAQREGPTSEAAQCMCAYCLARRAERDRLRDKARQLPSHAATVRAIKANS